jgi:hypothetical protein
MKKKIVLFSLLSFFLIACLKDKGTIPETVVTPTGACDTGYWYNGKIEKIIIASCAISGCHVPNGARDYTTYAGVKYDVDNGTFKQRVMIEKTMPQGSTLSSAQLERLQCWLDKGAPEVGTDGSGTTTGNTCSTTVSYSLTVAPFISTNCSSTSGCHEGGSVNGDYTSYAGLSAKVTDGKLNNRVVVVKDMVTWPIQSTPIPSTDVNKIDCWIQQGGLNN